jgi:hypothetical protein
MSILICLASCLASGITVGLGAKAYEGYKAREDMISELKQGIVGVSRTSGPDSGQNWVQSQQEWLQEERGKVFNSIPQGSKRKVKQKNGHFVVDEDEAAEEYAVKEESNGELQKPEEKLKSKIKIEDEFPKVQFSQDPSTVITFLGALTKGAESDMNTNLQSTTKLVNLSDEMTEGIKTLEDEATSLEIAAAALEHDEEGIATGGDFYGSMAGLAGSLIGASDSAHKVGKNLHDWYFRTKHGNPKINAIELKKKAGLKRAEIKELENQQRSIASNIQTLQNQFSMSSQKHGLLISITQAIMAAIHDSTRSIASNFAR